MTTVAASLLEGTQVDISARQFTWRGDEPPIAGGTDTGPTPYEILLGGLAACIAITLKVYANHKGFELPAVDVELEFDRVHAKDCVNCDTRTDGWIDRVDSRVTIRGDFDEVQRKRLTQVAQRCPVHKTLTGGMQIFDSVEFESVVGN